ncbi:MULTISPECIES: DUF3958 family protein [Listeria]|uniref:DUF3958 family protein n=1 Tax=Listeria TaxID=1637 RepID=UPI000B58B868|nr:MULTISPECIES: DUF3958 family protein [Listeria]
MNDLFEKLKIIRYQLLVAEEEYEKHDARIAKLKEAQQDYQLALRKGKQLFDELEYYWQGEEAKHFIFQAKDELFQEEKMTNEQFYDCYDEMKRDKIQLQESIRELEKNYRTEARED